MEGGRALTGGLHGERSAWRGRGADSETRYAEIRSTGGRYTSYSNAFLYNDANAMSLTDGLKENSNPLLRSSVIDL